MSGVDVHPLGKCAATLNARAIYSMARANFSESPDSTRFGASAQPVETSPPATWGEVSLERSKAGKRGGSRNRGDRETKWLTERQIANLHEGSEKAADIGLPLNRFITIDWEVGGIPLDGMSAATGRFIDLLTKWLRRRESPTAWIRVHENARSTGGHCHMIVHVPPECVAQLVHAQKRWLGRITGNPYRARLIKSVPIGGRLGLEASNPDLYRINLRIVVGYLCKGGLQPTPRWRKATGLVIGKRCGTSQNIGAKARRGV